MDDITINSYNELIDQIERISSKPILVFDKELRRYFFRGHANKEWKLIPTLLRTSNAQEDK